MQTMIQAMSRQDDLSARARLHQALIEGGHIGEGRPVGARRMSGRLNLPIREVIEAANQLAEMGCVRGTPREGYYVDEAWGRSALVGRRALRKAEIGPVWRILAAIGFFEIMIEHRPPHAAPVVLTCALCELIVLPGEVCEKLERAAA